MIKIKAVFPSIYQLFTLPQNLSTVLLTVSKIIKPYNRDEILKLYAHIKLLPHNRSL